jgi:NDP-sugar pyrophosphorylase family protein
MITGFVLAAGFGTRLKPVTEHVPKALVPFCGKPLLAHSLNCLHDNGIDRIGVNSYHLHEQMEFFRSQSGIKFELFHESEKIRGTGGALYFARNFLSSDEVFFVCNVDIVANADIKAWYETFLRLDCTAGLVSIPADTGGSVCYDPDTMDFIGLKSDQVTQGYSAEFIGMAFYRREFLEMLAEDDFSVVPVWKRCADTGLKVKVINAGNIYWRDVGTPMALAAAYFDVIEKKICVSIPDDMFVDTEFRRACLKSYSSKDMAKLGTNVWCESAKLPRDVFIDNCIVWRDAAFSEEKVIKNVIITKWGDISFPS